MLKIAQCSVHTIIIHIYLNVSSKYWSPNNVGFWLRGHSGSLRNLNLCAEMSSLILDRMYLLLSYLKYEKTEHNFFSD